MTSLELTTDDAMSKGLGPLTRRMLGLRMDRHRLTYKTFRTAGLRPRN